MLTPTYQRHCIIYMYVLNCLLPETSPDILALELHLLFTLQDDTDPEELGDLLSRISEVSHLNSLIVLLSPVAKVDKTPWNVSTPSYLKLLPMTLFDAIGSSLCRVLEFTPPDNWCHFLARMSGTT